MRSPIPNKLFMSRNRSHQSFAASSMIELQGVHIGCFLTLVLHLFSKFKLLLEMIERRRISQHTAYLATSKCCCDGRPCTAKPKRNRSNAMKECTQQAPFSLERHSGSESLLFQALIRTWMPCCQRSGVAVKTPLLNTRCFVHLRLAHRTHSIAHCTHCFIIAGLSPTHEFVDHYLCPG